MLKPGETIPDPLMQGFRARFLEAMARRVRRPLEPVPRYDQVYEEGLARMSGYHWQV